MEITIKQLQAYLQANYDGRVSEQGLFMKLVEEIGEVAEVMNQASGRKATHTGDLQAQLGAELADMIHYVVAIAAVNHIDLTDIILRKDRQASAKYHRELNLERFILQEQTGSNGVSH